MEKKLKLVEEQNLTETSPTSPQLVFRFGDMFSDLPGKVVNVLQGYLPGFSF